MRILLLLAGFRGNQNRHAVAGRGPLGVPANKHVAGLRANAY